MHALLSDNYYVCTCMLMYVCRDVYAYVCICEYVRVCVWRERQLCGTRALHYSEINFGRSEILDTM